jgi:hypothetical protein
MGFVKRIIIPIFGVLYVYIVYNFTRISEILYHRNNPLTILGQVW